MEFVNYFPLRLKEERLRLGLSQDEAAVLCGVSREMWGKYERGTGDPASSKLIAFGNAGADIVFIFTGIRAISTLDDNERLLLNYYRAAPDALKNAAMGVLLRAQTPQPQTITQTASGNGSVQIGGNNTGSVNNDAKGRKRK